MDTCAEAADARLVAGGRCCVVYTPPAQIEIRARADTPAAQTSLTEEVVNGDRVAEAVAAGERGGAAVGTGGARNVTQRSTPGQPPPSRQRAAVIARRARGSGARVPVPSEAAAVWPGAAVARTGRSQ
jgi:hypothetical protein